MAARSFPLCCLQVASTLGEARSVLDLKPRLEYSIQVRCSALDDLPLWSDWSESYPLYLDGEKSSGTSVACMYIHSVVCDYVHQVFINPLRP